MAVRISDGTTSTVASVGATSTALYTEVRDSNGANVAKTHRSQISDTNGALLIAGKNDDTATILRTDRKGNLLTGNYIPELVENFESTTINVQRWVATFSTFTSAQSTLGGLVFNNGAITTSGAHGNITSTRYFQKLPRVPLQYKARLRHSMVTGGIADFGFGVPTTTTLIVPNGVMFRMTSSGTVQGVLTLNSSEIAIGNVKSQVASNGNTIGGNLNMSAAYYTSNYFVYDIIIDDDNAIFTIQDTSTGELIGLLNLQVPVSQAKAWGATALPAYARLYHSAAPASASVFTITEMQVLSTDWNIRPDMSQLAASLHLSAGRNPYTGAQTENHTNSTAPTSATLSNTAAGYTTLGGKFQFAAPAGAVTDYCLFGFQVPSNSRFICEGIRIETRNTVAAVATTATTLEWAMGFNSTAVSLATANIIRRQVGTQVFPIGAAAEATATPIDITFQTPEVVESGRYVQVIMTIPVGTATATEIFRGQVSIKGRFI